jgi:hypothetical protein
MRRLAFIKYLYRLADEQSRAPDLRASAALLGFHDAIEMFLRLACEHVDVIPRPNAGILDYLDALGAKAAEPLPHQLALRRLNKARANLKHHGQLPATTDLEDYRHTTSAFLVDSSPTLFGIEFGSVSLVEFVAPEDARVHLALSIEQRARGDRGECAISIATAFHKMLAHYTQTPRDTRWCSPFEFDGSTFSLSHAAEQIPGGRKLARGIDDMLRPVFGALQILGLGLDFRRYASFMTIMPSIRYSVTGERYADWGIRTTGDPTDLELDRCFDFVIESALVLGTFDHLSSQG